MPPLSTSRYLLCEERAPGDARLFGTEGLYFKGKRNASEMFQSFPVERAMCSASARRL